MKDKLKEIKHIILDGDMREYTAFKAGGKADGLVIPQDKEELKQVLTYLDQENIPHTIIGNGSNFLIKDGGYRGVIIKVGEAFSKIEIEGNRMICGSGALLSSIARQALGASLTGFEFAAGIPGSMGGAVFMNAGAYGGEIKDCLKEVLVLSKDGKTEKTIGVDALELGYRTSRLQETGDIVLSATLEFAPGEEAEIRETMKTLFEQRNTKQPVNFPSAGSFFKRPTGYFAGKLIQDAGLKGLTVGGAQVSALHAGFIINIGGATATDIIQLMHLVQAAVMEKFGVMLEPEVRILGED